MTEWIPPINSGWQMNFLFGWLLVFIPLSALSPRKSSYLEWIWFFIFGWLAFSGVRFRIWFIVLLSYFSALLLAAPVPRLPLQKIQPPLINALFGIGILAMSPEFLPERRKNITLFPIPVYETETMPVKAVDWLNQQPDLRGPLWSDYAFSSYLDLFLPQIPYWMDARFHDFPREQWREHVQVSRAKDWQEGFDREQINILMLSHASQPLLMQAVSSSNRWCEEYQDHTAVIFFRCGEGQ